MSKAEILLSVFRR